MKKKIIVIIVSIFAVVFTIFLINFFDSRVSPKSAKLLESNLTSTDADNKKCISALGLFVNQELDSKVEGGKILTSINTIANETPMELSKIQVPDNIMNIDLPSNDIKCTGFCDFKNEKRIELKEKLSKMKEFLNRFKELISYGDFQCSSPIALLKLRLLSLLKLSKFQLIEYNLMSFEGREKEAYQGLEKMNVFFENTLYKEKYSVMQGLIYLTILNNVREMIVTHPKYIKEQVKFKKINYEDIVNRVNIGEVQIANLLINSSPLDYSVFESSNINEDGKKTEVVKNTLFNNLRNKILNYFYLKNDSINKVTENIEKASWHPCLGQKDIECKVGMNNYLSWIRNPVGNYLFNLMSYNILPSFRKIKTKVDKLNNELIVSSL